MFKTLLKIFGIIFVILAILIALFLKYPEPDIKIPELDDLAELDNFIEQVVKDNEIPSLAVAILDSAGAHTVSVFGERKKGGNTPVTKDDLYHLGSNTKAMTSALTGMIINDGLLDWDAKITDVFPELSEKIHADYKNVTVLDLLTHTSGLQGNYDRFHELEGEDMIEKRRNLIEHYLTKPAEQTKGAFLYSNLGYITAGAILENVTGKSWETLMNERLFVPLKMESAGFGVPGTIGKEDQPWGHIKVSGLLDFMPVQRDNDAVLGPAGTVHCSMEDWAKFLTFQLMSKDTTLLHPNQRTVLLEPITNQYACGWGVSEPTWADDIVYSHAGSNTFNLSQSWIIPHSNKGILINSNAHSKNMRGIFTGVRNAILEVDETQ